MNNHGFHKTDGIIEGADPRVGPSSLTGRPMCLPVRLPLIITIFILVGCSTTRIKVDRLSEEIYLPQPKEAEIILTTQEPKRPYQPIAFIKAKGDFFVSREEIEDRVKEKARELGADAVIKGKYYTKDSVGSIGSGEKYFREDTTEASQWAIPIPLSRPRYEGLAVKLLSEEEEKK